MNWPSCALRTAATPGKLLGQALSVYRSQPAVVYGIPRGGVATAVEIARHLKAPLDLIITRKIGHPYQPEYAIGAVAEDGHLLGNREELKQVNQDWLKQEIDRQRQEAGRRRQHYLQDRPPVPVENKIAILVDDGIATGTTMRLGIQELKHRNCKKIIVAVPVAPKSTADVIRREAGEIVALDIPEDYNYLGAVGAYYRDFAQMEDEEVIDVLNRYEKEYAAILQRPTQDPGGGPGGPPVGSGPGGHPPVGDDPVAGNGTTAEAVAPAGTAGTKKRNPSLGGKVEQLVKVQLEHLTLEGMLLLPESALGVVVFAHGSGSNRFSPRNNFVANVLHASKLGTLLIDLLTVKEDEVYATRFDIELLTTRLTGVVQWLKTQKEGHGLPIGLFGASTGAAAALKVAARLHKDVIASVVSRGGRPDLAIDEISGVTAPTLLIVGGNDFGVIELNQQAYQKLTAPVKKLEIVPGATHLFEEPGTLAKVAELTAAWFAKHFQAPNSARP